MINKKLNLMSYYGGKSNMSSMISDMLDYRHSKVYIELFGGAGSVLLNKIPHDIEIYNEYNLGIYTLFKVLKNKDTALELISRLYHNSEFSKDCFMDALAYRNTIEDNPLTESARLLFEYIKGVQEKHNIDWYAEYKKTKGFDNSFIDKIHTDVSLTSREILKGNKILNNYYSLIETYFPNIDKLLSDLYECIIDIDMTNHLNYKNEIINTDLKILQLLNYSNILQSFLKECNLNIKSQAYIVNLLNSINSLYKDGFLQMHESMPITTNPYNKTIEYDEIELAKSTYLIYQFSRDGIGKDFSSVKYRNNEMYLDSISNLYNVSERLKDVIITNKDAFSYFDLKTIINIIDSDGTFATDNIKESDILYYLDPPYLQQKPLDSQVLEEIAKINPGLVYKTGDFTYNMQKKFVSLIYDKNFKMLTSNYRDITNLYDTYLHSDYGWSSLEYLTKTTVGNKVDNQRIEVLWYNY